mgnify:CR=1 FL=1
MNTLQWNAAGIEVTYTINVKKAGNYNLTFHYDNGKKEFDSFETIKIDGEVPFSELYTHSHRFHQVTLMKHYQTKMVMHIAFI